MLRQVRLGDSFANTPVLHFVRSFQDTTQSFLGEARLSESPKDLLQIGLTLVIEQNR